MPLPFILGGVAIMGTLLGVTGHQVAKETNEKAQQVADDAKSMYDDAKHDLESAKERTERSLLNLGETKRNILENSVKQFRNAYERVKDIQLKVPPDLYEVRKFSIDNQQTLELCKMSDIYQNTLSSGAAGWTTGALIALAANGALPLVTGTLSLAGSLATIGEFGMAAGMVGSAFSLGAAFTPLSAVVAPVVFFTALSASMQADENLEKAQVMYSKAETAVAEMRVKETLCEGIEERANMLNDLLSDLDGMFSRCTAIMDVVTRKKVTAVRGRAIRAEDFTRDELKLLAVTRALAGAVKQVMDVPLRTKDGDLTEQSEDVYYEVREGLPAFHEQFEEVQEATLW